MPYRDQTPIVLNNMHFTINPKEKLGIVGRTGSGTSQLTTRIQTHNHTTKPPTHHTPHTHTHTPPHHPTTPHHHHPHTHTHTRHCSCAVLIPSFVRLLLVISR